MGPTLDLTTGLLFALSFVLLAGVAVYLISQAIDGGLSMWQALIIFCPLFLCWVGAGATIGGPHAGIARLLGILAVIWCALLPLQVRASHKIIEVRLSDEKIQHCLDFLAKSPNNPSMRFQLAELYEDRGWLREAYQEYAACLELDRHNIRARHRSAEIYEQITRKPMPGTQKATPAVDASQAFLPAVLAGDSKRLSSLREEAQKNPLGSTIYVSMAEELVGCGRKRDALIAYQKALQIDPSNDRCRANMHALMGADPEATSQVTQPVVGNSGV